MSGGTKARIAFLAVAGVLLAAGFVYRASMPRGPLKSNEFMMDTVVEQRAFDANAREAVDEVNAYLRELDGKLSLFNPNSEVSRINANAGVAPVAVSEDTFELIRLSVEFAEASGGDFDITTAPLKTLWNITGEHPRVPEQSEIETLLPLVNYRDIVLDEQNHTVLLRQKGQSIDLGGIAKGYAVGNCLELYRGLGETGYINAGGNVATESWKLNVGIRAPRGELSYFAALDLEAGDIMATSGDYERYFERDGVRYHHILDPKTGYPTQSGLISVSVISKDGAQADFLSTTLFIRGKNGLDSLRSVYDYEYVAVDKDLNVIVSPGLRERLDMKSSSTEYHLLS